MKGLPAACAAFCAIAASSAIAVESTPSGSPPTETNLFVLSRGALIEKATSIYGGWEPLRLTDEDPGTGWANADGDKPPFTVVLSLPERSEIRRFSFDTASAESPERAAKNIDILASDRPNGGFKPVISVTLEAGKDNQSFAPPTPVTGQWFQFVVKSNHGDEKYWETMEVRGFGIPLNDTPLPSVSGTYDGGKYGKFHLEQNGAQLQGCYEYKDGLIQGGLEGHLMRLNWSEQGGGHGPALMVAERNGKGFRGYWANEGDTHLENIWNLRKVASKIGACPHSKPKTASANIVATNLATAKRVRLYGITFDTESARPRPDAKPTLDQLTAALKAHGDWKITVEGHTDATGAAAHNKDLSERRAAAVVAYLTAAGIGSDRVTSAGFGAEKPVASNDSDVGRAQNRRVEVARE